MSVKKTEDRKQETDLWGLQMTDFCILSSVFCLLIKENRPGVMPGRWSSLVADRLEGDGERDEV